MNEPPPDRLSRITTAWTLLRDAHGAAADKKSAASELLLQRYQGAVYRYLLAALHCPDAAEELTQEFGLRLLRGDFHGVDPQKGRFRSYVKTVLFHLVSKYRKQQARRLDAPDDAALAAAAEEARSEDPDALFLKNWRDELLQRAWDALAETNPDYSLVLRFRAQHPNVASGEMAAQLTRQLNKPLTASGIRQTLHRARDKFADLLLDEVAHSLEPNDLERVEQELLELNLKDYCASALRRYQTRGN